MKQYKVGVVGATGMVGQRFITLLENHPWFKLTALAASARSAGKTYEDAVGSRWLMKTPMPEAVKKMVVLDASKVEEVAAQVDFVFCAVNMKKDEIKALEEAYAKAECPVVSNNSAHRMTPDVPMVVPEINALTASLVATAINPVVGLSSFLAQMLLRGPLIAATTKEFRIDGSWTAPQVHVITATSRLPQTLTAPIAIRPSLQE